MEEIPKEPGQEAKMAFAGPLTSIIIGSICLLTYRYLISPNPALSLNPVVLVFLDPWIHELNTGNFQPTARLSYGWGRVLRSYLFQENVLCEGYS